MCLMIWTVSQVSGVAHGSLVSIVSSEHLTLFLEVDSSLEVWFYENLRECSLNIFFYSDIYFNLN